MRSSGGTKLGLACSVVARTKSRMACFAAPSFHDGNGPPDGAACACAAAGRSSCGNAGPAANPASRTRRLMTNDGTRVLTFGFLQQPRSRRALEQPYALEWLGRPGSEAV